MKPTEWQRMTDLAEAVDMDRGALTARFRAGNLVDGRRVERRPATDTERLGICGRTLHLYRLSSDNKAPRRSGTARLTQANVNVCHRLAAEGVGVSAIAKRFGVSDGAVSYALRNRPANGRGDGTVCDRCGESFGSRRVRSVAGWVFCGPCHRWVFANHTEAKKKFKGIF